MTRHIGLFVLMAAGAAASGQPATRSDQVVEESIAALDAPALFERELAQARLEQTPGLSLSAIEAILARDGLAAEQRVRLEALAWRRFAMGPRAAMGVSFGPAVDGVMIASTSEGFASRELLVEGDVVLSAGGRVMRVQEDLRIAILAREPGERIPLRLRRAGEEIFIDLPLGSYDDLRGGARLTGEILAEAWRERQAIFSGDPGDEVVIDALLEASAGRREGAPIIRWRVPVSRGVVGGGMGRGGLDAWGRVRVQVNGHDLAVPSLALGAGSGRPGESGFRLDRLLEELRVEQDRLRTYERLLLMEIEALPGGSEPSADLMREIRRIRRLMTSLNSEIDDLWRQFNAISSYGR
ncbi:MAG: PDZ domain-containing protein [Phycisphaeraceae bacterium]|nr:PDZ domain-containing protein [Phycisphaeraceae bacterium]